MTVQELFEQLRELTPKERQEVRKLLDALDDPLPGEWTEEALAHALHVTPLTGAEIAESEAVGAWAHYGIKDGAEWANEQRAKRRGNHQW